jgi:hypothetical protein
MIRLGTPIFDNAGNKRGIMLLNYFGSKMLDGINRVAADSSGDLMFLNKDGFFLKGTIPEDEWGFMYEERRNRTFGNKFPEAWQQILDSDSGQFQNGDGFFLFETIYPLKEFHKTSTVAANSRMVMAFSFLKQFTHLKNFIKPVQALEGPLNRVKLTWSPVNTSGR